MRTDSVQKSGLAAATRGLIVQRVLVDGWTPEKAGAQFGIDGRRVARWVAAYRHHGMAALRAEAAETGPLRWVEACLTWIGLAWIGAGCAAAFARQNDPSRGLRTGAARLRTRPGAGARTDHPFLG